MRWEFFFFIKDNSLLSCLLVSSGTVSLLPLFQPPPCSLLHTSSSSILPLVFSLGGLNSLRQQYYLSTSMHCFQSSNHGGTPLSKPLLLLSVPRVSHRANHYQQPPLHCMLPRGGSSICHHVPFSSIMEGFLSLGHAYILVCNWLL